MTKTPQSASDREDRVARLAAEQGKVLIAHKRLDAAFKPCALFALAEDTPEAITAVGDDLDHHRTGTSLQAIEEQLLQTKAAIITAEAQALADEITWDENDQAVVSEAQLVNLLVRVITEERKL